MKDPTYGRIDRDIQQHVDSLRPSSLGSRVAMENTLQQRRDGSWEPAQPIGWQEEHGWLARFVLWVLRRPHCCDAELERYRR